MSCQTSHCPLSDVAKTYLDVFSCILETMIKEMTEAALSDSVSHNFIVQMIPHHRAAIEMSNNILNYTTDLAVQNIATQIIKEQTQSIEDMQNMLPRCECMKNTREALCLYNRQMNRIMQAMFSAMGAACATNRLNINFLREMIPHHRGAVEMSRLTLQYPVCPELTPILESIIAEQERGIMQMQHLLFCGTC